MRGLIEMENQLNDYLTETLETEESARKEIFLEMLRKLEREGMCRGVYHRLAFVLFGDSLGEY
jgi:hypothetical protein